MLFCCRLAEHEHQLLLSLDHPRIIKILGRFDLGNDGSFCSVLELSEDSDLAARLRAHGHLPEKEAQSFIAQVVEGLCYLSTMKPAVIHHDLKPGEFENNFTFYSFWSHHNQLSATLNIYCG